MGKPRKLTEWTLDNLINVAYETGYIQLHIKIIAIAWKSLEIIFIQDSKQCKNFNPNKHTAEISFKVLQAVITDLTKSWEWVILFDNFEVKKLDTFINTLVNWHYLKVDEKEYFFEEVELYFNL